MDFFRQIEAEFGPFTLDPCATAENAKAPKFYTLEENGLNQSWAGERVYMNPPYGRQIPKWVGKAYEESKRGAFVVCLVPARTDAGWWHDYCLKGEVRFIRGRLKFGGNKWNAPFPSAVVIFRGAAR
jgi:phage N-6-adenine-methyltransferase